MATVSTALREAAYGALDWGTGHRGITRSINGELIRFPARWCRYFPRSYEPDKHRFLATSCRPDTVAIDVGAHIGLFTVVMARRAGQMLAFEPAPQNREVLRETVRLNGLDHVEVRGEAVSDREGEADLHLVCPHTHSLIGDTRSTRVSTVSVDSLGLQRPISCIKIDAEGAELAILRGARQTIGEHRPAIACEVHPKLLHRTGADPIEILEFLEEAGYILSADSARFASDEMFEFLAAAPGRWP